MRVSLTRISVLAFAAFWFGVYLPGHERGVIQLPGRADNCHASGSAASGKSCCPSAKESTKPGAPDAPKRGNCAVCFHMTMLGTTAWFIVSLPDSQLLSTLAPTPYRQMCELACVFTSRARDPPVIA